METKVFVETDCVIEHEGHKFEAGGAVLTDTHLIGYTKFVAPLNEGRSIIGTRVNKVQIKSWHGDQVLAEGVVTSHWRTPRSYVSDCMYQLDVKTPDGKRYTGRTAGDGMIFRGRAKK